MESPPPPRQALLALTVGALLPVQGAISPPRGVPSGSEKEAVKVTLPLLQDKEESGLRGFRQRRRGRRTDAAAAAGHEGGAACGLHAAAQG